MLFVNFCNPGMHGTFFFSCPLANPKPAGYFYLENRFFRGLKVIMSKEVMQLVMLFITDIIVMTRKTDATNTKRYPSLIVLTIIYLLRRFTQVE